MKTNYFFRKTFMLALLAVGFYSYQTNAQTIVNGIAYNIINDGAAAEVAPLPNDEKYSAASISIPTTVEINGTTYPVKKIGDGSMRENPNLTSLTIAEGVEIIGNSAFAQCPAIAEVVIPSSVQSIEDWAFFACTKLAKVNIPDGITAITEHTFQQTALTSVELPASVTRLGTCAFQTVRGLTSINLENIRNIGSWALAETAIGPEITLTGVQYLGNYAFYDCQNIQKVVLNGIIQTGEASFQYNRSLTSIIFTDGLESIDNYAFSGCSNLPSLVIPNTVQFLGQKAFESSGIKEMYISWENPDDLITDENIFGEGEGLINFVWKVPESLIDIYGNQFMGYPVEIGEPVGIATEQINSKNVYYSNGNLNLTDMEGCKVSVISLDGRTIASFQVNGANVQLPVSLNSGIYLLNASNGNNRSAVKFVVR